MPKKILKERTKDALTIGALIVAYIVWQILIIRGDTIGRNAYNGVLSALQFGTCIIMVIHNYKYGWITSISLLSISLIMMIMIVASGKSDTPIPGIVNLLFYLITLTMLARQFKVRDKEAVTDFLTGLLNRRGLYKYVNQRIEDNSPFYLIYIDLGNFKFINDNFGHSYGDAAMRVVTERMASVLKKSGVITRIGGDEFVVVLDGKHDPGMTARKLIDRICEKTTLTVEGSEVDCYLTAFAGIASYPEDADDCETLIKSADIAMYQASKDQVGPGICFFDMDMAFYLRKQMELEHLVKEGLDKNYFYLNYQPQYKMDGKTLRGFESLIRMKTPEGKIISPGDFIPVAESSDLIIKIDELVLEMAMREFRDVVWNQNPDLVISVNVSAKNVGNVGFVSLVSSMLNKVGFPAKNLEIEITEYCLVQSVEITIDNIKKLRKMGVQVALDDFGTGYTSLSYLSKMPINLLKIDKSLVDNIESTDKGRDFVKAVIYMGHLMGCEVISEGVEKESQLSVLKAEDCDFIQGFIWGKPLEYADAFALVEKNSAR